MRTTEPALTNERAACALRGANCQQRFVSVEKVALSEMGEQKYMKEASISSKAETINKARN